MPRFHKDGRPYSPMWDEWTLEHEARLAEYAGSMDVPDLATALSLEFGINRTSAAVRIHAKKMGVSLWRSGMSMGDLERIFSVGHRAIKHWWIEPGLLLGRRWKGRGPFDTWIFEVETVKTFIVQHGYAYDWRAMQTGHPLRALAEIQAKRDAWFTLDELAAYIGISRSNLKRWLRRGLVPHHRRRKSGSNGWIMIRAADVPTIAENIRAAQRAGIERSRALFTARRRAASRAA